MSICDYLIPKHYSYYCKIIRIDHFHFLRLGISGWGIWFFYGSIGVWFEVGIFLCGGVWVFQWFYIVGLTMGILARLGLRYRLLWFWVFG